MADTECEECDGGYFTPPSNHLEKCRPCSKCGPGLYEIHECTRTADTECDSCSAMKPHINDDYLEKCITDLQVHHKPKPNKVAAFDNMPVVRSSAPLQEYTDEVIDLGSKDTSDEDEEEPKLEPIVDHFPEQEERDADEAVMRMVNEDVARNMDTVAHERIVATEHNTEALWRLGGDEIRDEKTVDPIAYMPSGHNYDLKAVLHRQLSSVRTLQMCLAGVCTVFAVIVIVLVARNRCDTARRRGGRACVQTVRQNFAYAPLTDDDLKAIKTSAAHAEADSPTWSNAVRVHDTGFTNPLADYFEKDEQQAR